MATETTTTNASDDQAERDYIGTATYSPDDNKIRIYPFSRLSTEDYARVKAAGFSWAPKQELFVAPAWSPEREDLALELCGEIDDEDKSLVERAEERAERFEDYSDKRERDANRAHDAVNAITEHIPLGQPILIGHHSERHARRDAEKIENGMRRAVKLWETSKYWTSRAAGAIRAAKYKELPAVRARRIKGLESEKRKIEKTRAECVKALETWTREGLTLEQARAIAGRTISGGPIVTREGYSQPYGGWSAFDVLRPDGERYQNCPSCTVEQVQAAARRTYPRHIARCDRWLDHYNNRLAYENAMLGRQGGLPADNFKLEVGGMVLTRHNEWVTILRINKTGGKITSVSTNARYVSVIDYERIMDYREPDPETVKKVKAATKLAPLCNYPGDIATWNKYNRCSNSPCATLEMTKEEWEKRAKEYKGTCDVAATETHLRHRVRIALNYKTHNYDPVYITDEPVKRPPLSAGTDPEPPATLPRERDVNAPVARAYVAPEPTKFDALKDSLKAGVQVVAAPQLFPTPPELARRVVELADVKYNHEVLEPSAGTGNLIKELPVLRPQGFVVAVEINCALASMLRPLADEVKNTDFLTCNGDLGQFDRIIMNPPFENGSDIKHIRHAMTFLKPGGRLVAICANGPRQREQLMPLAAEWHDLPADSFKEQGTSVNTAIMVFDAE